MDNVITVLMSRQMSLRRQLEVVANNLANVNTTGFRAGRLLFQEAEARTAEPVTGRRPTLSMAIDQALIEDPRPGPLLETGNPMDVALQESVFMVVQTSSGPRYSRNGHLAIDSNRQLVEASGLPILDTGNQPIVLPENAERIIITGTGEVTYFAPVAGNAGAARAISAGRIRLVQFEHQTSLDPLGGGLYVTNETPVDAEDAQLIQGMVEQSNVEPIQEMTALIEIHRQYQSNQRLLDDEQDRQRTIIRRLSQTGRG